ncbi:hypothetical protein lerEdw1_017523, partial [Lerista edwardsae]
SGEISLLLEGLLLTSHPFPERSLASSAITCVSFEYGLRKKEKKENGQTVFFLVAPWADDLDQGSLTYRKEKLKEKLEREVDKRRERESWKEKLEREIDRRRERESWKEKLEREIDRRRERESWKEKLENCQANGLIVLLHTVQFASPSFCNSQNNKIKIKMLSARIQMSENVELECEDSSNAGIYWIHQNMANTPKSILYISSRGRTTPETTPDFHTAKSGTAYKLTVKKFKKESEGIYYCAAHQGQTLIFSQSLQVYLPVTTTTPMTTPQRNATPPQATKEPMEWHLSTSVDEKLSDNGLKFSCAQYIWIPLAGGCFLLLIILVITLSICCGKRIISFKFWVMAGGEGSMSHFLISKPFTVQ